MIGLDVLYVIAGVMFGGFALSHALDRDNPQRWRSAGFWGGFAVLLLGGTWLPDIVNGLILLAMVGLATLGLRAGATPAPEPVVREASAARLGNRLFIPALAIPIITLAGSLLLHDGRVGSFQLIDPKQVTLVSLATGAVVGLLLALKLTGARPATAAAEGRRLVDSIGWAVVLPQMLAALGAIFALAGVGEVVAELATSAIPMTLPVVAVVVYTVGMALFTMVMGNAFAAFPVMTAGIGIPIIIGQFGGNPAIMSALGMLSGFCGTLMTPMAANFNIVPAAVLELADRNAVIKVQVPTALILLAANTILMALFVFPK